MKGAIVHSADQSPLAAKPAIRGAIILGGSYGSLAVARSLGRNGIPVCYFSAQHSIARHSRYVTRNIDWAGPGAPDALNRMLDAARKYGMDDWVLLPSGDAEVQFVTQNFVELTDRFKLVTMPWNELEQLNDKARLYRLAAELGMAYPLVYEDEFKQGTAVEDIRFPVVIKPASTEKSNDLTRAKAWKAETPEEYVRLHALATQMMGPGGFVVQEMVPGDGRTQYSYAGLWDHGHEVAGLTVRRARHFPIDFGTSPFVESVEEPRAAAEARRLLQTVNYHGLVEVEFKHDLRDDRFKVLDVNTRIWAWIGLGIAAGLDFPMLAANLAVGAEMPAALEAVYGATWVHPIRNMLSVVQNLVRRGNAGYAAWRSLFGSSVSATSAPDDPRPALAELPVQLMRRLKKVATGPALDTSAVIEDRETRTSAPR